MKIELIKNIELYKICNTVVGYEKSDQSLDNHLKSIVIGNSEGGKKIPYYIRPGSKEKKFAAIPVTIDDIIVTVECDIDYNILIEVMRVQTISKVISGKIYASCNIIDMYVNEKWYNDTHNQYSEIIQAALLRATSLKKTAVYVEEKVKKKK